MAAELVHLKMDVIFASGTPAVLATQKVTSTIPTVILAGDPVGSGLVRSLARPGGNTTGVSSIDVELSAKLLELLLSVAPRTSKVAVLANPTNLSNTLTVKHVQAAARDLGKSVLVVGAKTAVEIEEAFSVMAQQGAGSVLVARDTLFDSQRRQIAGLAAKNRLPSIGGISIFAEAGGLLSYGADLADQIRLVATYVGKILKGARPADLPVQQPVKFDLVVNLKTAKALGITIPPELLQRADRVIE